MDVQWLKQFVRLFLGGVFIFLLLLPLALSFSVEPGIIFFITIILLAIWRKQKEVWPKLRRFGTMGSIVFGALVFLGLVAWWISGNPNSMIVLVAIGFVFIMGALVLID